MTLVIASFALCCLAILIFHKAGRRAALRLALVVWLVVCGIISALWLGLNQITGTGINDAVFYHMSTGLEGGDISQYAWLIGAGVLGLAALIYAGLRLYRKLGKNPTVTRLGDGLALGVALISVAVNPFFADVARQSTAGYFVVQQTEGYAEPRLGAQPARKKNLVLIYMESVERSYFDESVFPGLITDLRKLEAQGQSFTRVGQSIGASFTIGGMVAGQCGVPLLLSGTENSMQVSSFLSGATCLGDLLDEAGYHTEYFGGASTEFAGKGSFYKSHGFDQVTGLEDLQAGLEDPTYLGPWGLQDDTLFGLAKTKLDGLAAGADPFALVMLTLDTHHPDGHANTNRSCQDVVYGDGSNPMLTSVKCADKLAGAFIQSILDSPLAEDTVIVVASDHIAMVNGAADDLAKTDRSNMFFILEPGATPAQSDREASTMDLGPTIMAALGFEGAPIGFGVNLFGTEPTLAEKMPGADGRAELFADYLMGFQTLYTRLWDYPKLAAGFYVNLEGKLAQFGPASFRLPALMNINAEGALQDITIADPLSEKTLAGKVMTLPGDQPLLWLDDCAVLAPLGKDVPATGLCLLSGAMAAADLVVRPVSESAFVASDSLWAGPLVADEAALAQRQKLLRDGLLGSGNLPGDLALDVAGYAGGDVILRSVAGGNGASLVRLLTTESTHKGVDVVLARGINLIGLAPDGQPKLLAHVDTCEPGSDPVPAFAQTMQTEGDSQSAYVILAHDSANCEAGPQALQTALAGLDLAVGPTLRFRQPYVALLRKGVPPVEFTSADRDRLLLRLRADKTVADMAPVQPSTSNPLPTTPALAAPAPVAAAAALAPAAQTPNAATPAAATAAVPAANPNVSLDVCVPPNTIGDGLPPVAGLPLGSAVSFAAPSPGTISFGKGWWDAEEFGRWIGAPRATITVVLPEGQDQSLVLSAIPYGKKPVAFQLWAGEVLLGETKVAEGAPAGIDVSSLPKRVPVALDLVFPDATLGCPLSDGIAEDARVLIAMVKAVALQGSAPESLAHLDDLAICIEPNGGAATLATTALEPKVPNWIAEEKGQFGFGPGFWVGEDFGRWIGTDATEINLILPAARDPVDMEITGAAFGTDVTRVELRYLDQLLFAGPFGKNAPIVFETGQLPQGEVIVLQLSFPGAPKSCPKGAGQFGDDRRLVAMLESVSLQPHVESPLGPLPTVAHAGGEIDNTRITDSLDALNANKDQYDLFEMDLSWTADNQLVCLHDWKDSFMSRFGYMPEGPLTLAAFEALLSDGKHQNCTLDSLANWLQRHPTKRVLTDLKSDNLRGLELIADKYPELRSSLVPQAYQPEEIAQIKALGFQDVIWTLYQFEGDPATVIAALKQNAVLALTMPKERAQTGLAQQVLDEVGVQSYVHTVNDPHEAGCFANLGVAGIYTDVLRGPFPQRKGPGNDTCQSY